MTKTAAVAKSIAINLLELPLKIERVVINISVPKKRESMRMSGRTPERNVSIQSQL